jgi:hypothetical protein
MAASVALIGATHCGGDAKSDVGAPAGSSQGGGTGKAGSSSTGGGSASNGGSASSAGAVSTGAGGALGGSGSGSAGSPSACGGARSAPVGRPTASACPVTSPNTPNASPHACVTDSDCADAGALPRCLSGTCGFDQCLVDSDCPSGQACGCSDQQGGNIIHTNSCVPAGCRVDADCGTNGTCSPDASARCGSLSGYQCHAAADTCNSDADCCGSTPRCGYQPELGHWACAAIAVCNG